MRKLRSWERKEPRLREMGPKEKTAVFQEFVRKRGEKRGMMMSWTREVTRLVVAVPMTKAIARDMTLYSLRKVRKPLSIGLFGCNGWPANGNEGGVFEHEGLVGEIVGVDDVIRFVFESERSVTLKSDARFSFDENGESRNTFVWLASDDVGFSF